MKVIHPYIHEYNFDYEDNLKPYISEFIKVYNTNIKNKITKTNNLILPRIPIINSLENNLVELVRNNYYAGYNTIDSYLNLYVQDNKVSTENYHNHMNSPGNLSLIFYMNIPKEGGEIEFMMDHGENFRLKPQLHKVYVFPNWLYHKPTKHEDNIDRLCFNWIYTGNIRPIHKNLGYLW